jgi:hypothetical protein
MKREQTRRKLTLTPETLAHIKVVEPRNLSPVHGGVAKFESADPPCSKWIC